MLRHVLLYALRVSPSGILQELGHRHRSAWLVNSSCQCAFEAIRLLFRSVDVGNSAGQHPQQGRAYYQDTSQPDGIRKMWTKTGFPCLLQLAHGARSHKLVLRHAPGPAAAHQHLSSFATTSSSSPACPGSHHRGFRRCPRCATAAFLIYTTQCFFLFHWGIRNLHIVFLRPGAFSFLPFVLTTSHPGSSGGAAATASSKATVDKTLS